VFREPTTRKKETKTKQTRTCREHYCGSERVLDPVVVCLKQTGTKSIRELALLSLVLRSE